MARNIDNTLYCPYGEVTGCLAQLNATSGGPAEDRIQPGEVSGYWFLTVTILILSSIKYPVPAFSDINVCFQNFIIFGFGLSGLGSSNRENRYYYLA